MKKSLITLAALGSVLGLPASLASAQGLVVEKECVTSTEDCDEKKIVIIQKIQKDDHECEVTIKDGVITVLIDGKEVSQDQIKKNDKSLTICNEDGSTLHEFTIDLTVGDGHLESGAKRHVAFVNLDGGSLERHEIQRVQEIQIGSGTPLLIGRTVLNQDGQPLVMLGINLSETDDELRKKLGIPVDSILVEHVIDGLSADKAGIQDRDIIVSIDGSEGMTMKSLGEILGKHQPGDEIQVVVVRNGKKLKIGTELQAYDAESLRGGEFRINNVATSNDSHKVFYLSLSGDSERVFNITTQDIQQATQEFVESSMRKHGVDEDHILKIEVQVKDSLKSIQGAIEGAIYGGDGEHGQIVIAESMRKKAQQALENAERITLEYKDGQLFLKRHTEQLEQKIHMLNKHAREAMPAIRSDLEDRLGTLEERLEELEGKLEGRLDRLTDSIERLINRLDED